MLAGAASAVQYWGMVGQPSPTKPSNARRPHVKVQLGKTCVESMKFELRQDQRGEMPSGDSDGYYVFVALITATVVLTLATVVGVSLSLMVQ